MTSAGLENLALDLKLRFNNMKTLIDPIMGFRRLFTAPCREDIDAVVLIYTSILLPVDHLLRSAT